MDGWMRGWMDGWMDGWMALYSVYLYSILLHPILYTQQDEHGYRRVLGSDAVLVLVLVLCAVCCAAMVLYLLYLCTSTSSPDGLDDETVEIK